MRNNRGDSELAGLIALAVFGLVIYGLWVGGVSIWREVSGDDRPAIVQCRAGSQVVFEGIAKHGVRKSGDRISLTDINGADVSIDGAATCVSTAYTKEEARRADASRQYKTSTGAPQ